MYFAIPAFFETVTGSFLSLDRLAKDPVECGRLLKRERRRVEALILELASAGADPQGHSRLEVESKRLL